MTDFAVGTGGLPGMGPVIQQTSRDFFRSHAWMLKRGIHLHPGTVDAGSVPTTKLRGGLVLVRVEAGTHKNKFVHPGHADAPTSGNVVQAVILLEDVNMLNESGAAADKSTWGLYGGYIDEDLIFFSGIAQGFIDDIKAKSKLILFEKTVP